MLFFDIISCPYVNNTDKKSLLTMCDIQNKQEEIISDISKHNWFFGWDESINIKTFLEIKEFFCKNDCTIKCKRKY